MNEKLAIQQVIARPVSGFCPHLKHRVILEFDGFVAANAN